MANELTDIDCRIMATTEKAIQITTDDGDSIWLPLSQVEIEKLPRGLARVTLPVWLAEKKGLV